jgi:hypothetical protein
MCRHPDRYINFLMELPKHCPHHMKELPVEVVATLLEGYMTERWGVFCDRFVGDLLDLPAAKDLPAKFKLQMLLNIQEDNSAARFPWQLSGLVREELPSEMVQQLIPGIEPGGGHLKKCPKTRAWYKPCKHCTGSYSLSLSWKHV